MLFKPVLAVLIWRTQWVKEARMLIGSILTEN